MNPALTDPFLLLSEDWRTDRVLARSRLPSIRHVSRSQARDVAPAGGCCRLSPTVDCGPGDDTPVTPVTPELDDKTSDK